MIADITVDPDDDGELERNTGLRQMGRVDVEVKAVFASDQELRFGANHVYLAKRRTIVEIHKTSLGKFLRFSYLIK
jgi:hypothetical protein